MGIEINPLSKALGVEVLGLDLSKPLDAETIKTVYTAFVENVILIFRDQKLDHHQFLAAATQFGEPMPRHGKDRLVPDCPLVSYVTNQIKQDDGKPKIYGSFWHTDHSFQPEPPKATLLNSVTLPDTGGDTYFANTRAAYDALPEATRKRIDKLKAVHFYQDRREPPSAEERKREAEATSDEVTDGVAHPVARTHPDTGHKAIYINPLRVKRFVGMAPEDCVQLIEELAEHATQPQFVHRYTWRTGDVIMWDNRQALHKATKDYDLSQPRLLHRLILKGDKPS